MEVGFWGLIHVIEETQCVWGNIDWYRKLPIGHKFMFTCKVDSQGWVIRYKIRLVVQGFTQRLVVDFHQTYSTMMDCILFRYIISLTVRLALKIYLLDVVTAYLHSTLDFILHINPPPRLLKSVPKPKSKSFTCLMICKPKKSCQTRYHHLCRFMISQGFIHKTTLPYLLLIAQTLDLW